jgi:hypothetical protein
MWFKNLKHRELIHVYLDKSMTRFNSSNLKERRGDKMIENVMILDVFLALIFQKLSYVLSTLTN